MVAGVIGIAFFLYVILRGISVVPVQAVESMGSLDKSDVEQVVRPNLPAFPFQEGQLIVKFKHDTEGLKALNLQYPAAMAKRFRTGAELIKLPGISRDELIELKDYLNKSGLVQYAEFDYLVHPAEFPSNDPLFFRLWGLQNRGQIIGLTIGKAGIDINAVSAWTITKGSPEMVVAVIDTGVDLGHPELQDRAWVNPGEIPGNGIDDDNNGYVDDVNGWDFLNNDNTVYDAADNDIHGTHVAGTIAADFNNGQGICGVAPNVKIMAIKFIGPDGGSISDAISAIEYTSRMGVKLSNNSWSGTEYSQAMKDAIDQSGMLFVAASGNSGANTDSTPEYPAAYESNNIISVAGIDNQGNLPSWSNYGPATVDLGAPGAGITSIFELIPNSHYLYGSMSGTSQATPHVTGTAALVMSQFPGLTPQQVKDRIIANVKPLSSLQGKTVSGGMVDAYGSLTGQP